MFNVTRQKDAPACLAKNKYNTPEIVNILLPMFFEKCYLCERDELQDPEIEHFDPHEDDDSKKFDWNNLYYACSRCNGLKSNSHKNLLDCCDSSIDIFRAIKCTMPSTPDEPIKVVLMSNELEVKSMNTVILLNRCYNEKNTALRTITHAVLLEKLYEYYTQFLGYRLHIVSKKYSEEEKIVAKGRIKTMVDVKFPFSVFWRWHLIGDKKLREIIPELINF